MKPGGTGAGFRAALIGCGAIGASYDEQQGTGGVYTHAGMYRATPWLTLAAAVDPDPRRLAVLGTFWQVGGLYASLADLPSSERFDIVSVATPDESHEADIRSVLERIAPRIIFVEKPLAATADRAASLARECASKDVTLIVDYVRRWDERHRLVRDYVQAGLLGEVERAVGYYVRGIRHNGCQMVNLMRFIFGEIAEVSGSGDHPRSRRPAQDARGDGGTREPGQDASLDLRMRSDSGIPLDILALDRRGYAFSVFELDIIGSKGRIRLLDGGRRAEFFEARADANFPNFRSLAPASSPFPEGTYERALLGAGEELVAILAGTGDNPTNSARDAVKDLAVIDAAFRSAAREGIPERPDRIEEDF